jgi:hypothetical protein
VKGYEPSLLLAGGIMLGGYLGRAGFPFWTWALGVAAGGLACYAYIALRGDGTPRRRGNSLDAWARDRNFRRRHDGESDRDYLDAIERGIR